MLRPLLNIASIVCLVACVALMGMWVRSDSELYEFTVLSPFWEHPTEMRVYRVLLASGRLQCWYEPARSNEGSPPAWHSTFESRPVDPKIKYRVPDPSAQSPLTPFGFAVHLSRAYSIVTLPYWFLVLVTGSLSLNFRLRWPWRFNLRTLFIATTFLAIVLGMVAWLDRPWIGK
jgi:hypothetical protein